MAEPPKPRGQQGSGADDTLPATDAPLVRSSRASIPPLPTERYELGTEIGRGGMGRVVEAYDTQLGRTVALKEVLPRAGNVARRFLREIEITARLEHASIVALYDSGISSEGRPFYVMRRVTGRPLEEEIQRTSSLDERLMLLPAMLSAIDAIAHAHKRGVIHRDIKPGNILVGELGETVVIDWGLAKVIGEASTELDDDSADPGVAAAADSLHTQVGSVFGTPGFMSPEQARGEVLTTTVDVYALGATLYQLLAGKPPLGGDSATELIGKTLKHEVTPLREVVDGVPHELVAIVDKALSFDATVRYRDAGELAADLRRFQNGQLVAAHSYTSRQRVIRFARRNRNLLVVAAIAVATVTALAWFSVHRIVQERDLAAAAREQALVDKGKAELAAARLAERNDALMITRARTLLAINPTQAIATLAEIPATSPRLGEARAVAQAAVARGVWWGLDAPTEFTVRVQLSIDGKRLLQLTRDGVLRVWDLERRRLIVARPFPLKSGATWVNDRVLVFGRDRPAELFEPAANKSVPLTGLDPISYAVASADGATLLALMGTQAVLVDVATRTTVPLWPGHAVQNLDLSADGTWLALADGKQVAVFDRQGAQLAIHDGDLGRQILGPRRMAILSKLSAIELVLDPTPVWRTIPIPSTITSMYDGVYVGTLLNFYVYPGDIALWNGTKVISRGLELKNFDYPMHRIGTDGIAVAAGTKLEILSGATSITITVPTGLPHSRIVTAAGTNRVCSIGDGALFCTDLSDVLPRLLPARVNTQVTLFDEDTLLERDAAGTYSWVTISTGERVSTEVSGMSTLLDIDPPSGRVLMRELGVTAPRILLLRKGDAVPTEVSRSAAPWARLLLGDGIMLGDEKDGRVFVKTGAAAPRELFRLEGAIISAAPLAPLELAVLSDRGEVVHAHVTRGVLERIEVPPVSSMFLASDRARRIVIVLDARVLVWEAGVLSEITKHEKPIVSLVPLTDGTAILTAQDHGVHRLALRPGAKPIYLLTSIFQPVVDANLSRLIDINSDREIVVIDLDTNARWSLPPSFSLQPPIQTELAPGGTLVVQSLPMGIVGWPLTKADADLVGWIRERTTATVKDDVLSWPWNDPRP